LPSPVELRFIRRDEKDSLSPAGRRKAKISLTKIQL